MTGPNFRFREGHTPDPSTKFSREPNTRHVWSCGYSTDQWTNLIGHVLRPAGTWQQEAKAA